MRFAGIYAVTCYTTGTETGRDLHPYLPPKSSSQLSDKKGRGEENNCGSDCEVSYSDDFADEKRCDELNHAYGEAGADALPTQKSK